MRGPSYLFIGSRLTDDTYMLRTILEGLNTYGRQWEETLTILDNGTLQNLDKEVEQFRMLEHKKTEVIGKPNIVIAFQDRAHHNHLTDNWIKESRRRGIPTFVVSTYW